MSMFTITSAHGQTKTRRGILAPEEVIEAEGPEVDVRYQYDTVPTRPRLASFQVRLGQVVGEEIDHPPHGA